MIIPKNSEVYHGVKFISILTSDTPLSELSEGLTIKHNSVIIVKDGQPRPKSLECAKHRGANKVALIKRLTRFVTSGKIQESDYYKILWNILHDTK